jgi:hypothetical protein
VLSLLSLVSWRLQLPAHSLRFRDFDNSDLKDFSKRNSSRPPGVLLFWFFDFLQSPFDAQSNLGSVHSLHRIFTQGSNSCGRLCTPCTSLFALLAKGKFRAISYDLQNRNKFRQRTPCVLCAHLAPLSTEEKQLKLILTFTVPSTHNEIHSFIHENTITENCKTMSTPCVGSIFLCYIHK